MGSAVRASPARPSLGRGAGVVRASSTRDQTRPGRPAGRELICEGVVRWDPLTATFHPRVRPPSQSSSLSTVAVAQLPRLADNPRVDGGMGRRAGLTRGRVTRGKRAPAPARQPPRGACASSTNDPRVAGGGGGRRGRHGRVRLGPGLRDEGPTIARTRLRRRKGIVGQGPSSTGTSIRQGARLSGQGAHAWSLEAKEVYRTILVYRLKHPHIERGLVPIVLHVRQNGSGFANSRYDDSSSVLPDLERI